MHWMGPLLMLRTSGKEKMDAVTVNTVSLLFVRFPGKSRERRKATLEIRQARIIAILTLILKISSCTRNLISM